MRCAQESRTHAAAAASCCMQVGMALNGKRVIASIGDGSFQVTAQDITTMMREGQCPDAEPDRCNCLLDGCSPFAACPRAIILLCSHSQVPTQSFS